jgi:hypothetical protein
VPILLLVPPDSSMARRQKEAHNDPVWTFVAPGAGHCVPCDQSSGYLVAVDASFAEVARA